METAFKNTLKYTAPTHGDWGIVRIASLVPESFSLFVCPSACGRHGALGALAKGFKDRLAYVYINQSDIIGGYDDKIIEGVDELLRRVKKRPRALFVYVSCLDELIGTDMQAIIEKLRVLHNDVHFAYGRMNPISADTSMPPGIITHASMFSLLNRTACIENRVNLLGVLEGIPRESDLFDVLHGFGFDEVKQISDMTTYDDFQTMANSAYNVMVSPMAKMAAKNMKKDRGVGFVSAFVSYDMHVIEAEYKNMAAFFAKPLIGLNSEKEEARKAIANALSVVNDTPIVVCDGATLKPFELARTLISYGFNVQAVAASEVELTDEQIDKMYVPSSDAAAFN